MSKDAVQRRRHPGEIQRVDEQGRGLNLPAPVGAEETPELLLRSPPSPRRLLLEGAERFKLTLSLDDPFHSGGPEGTDQLVLQVRDAHVETESFHVDAREVGPEAGPLETAPEVALLAGVTEARQFEAKAPRTEPIEEASDVRRAPQGHDGNTLSLEIPTTVPGQRFERELIADPLDQDDRPGEEGFS